MDIDNLFVICYTFYTFKEDKTVGIFRFLRKKVDEKINESVSQKSSKELEDSKEYKIRRELMARNYNSRYIFIGSYERTVNIKGKLVTYNHEDYFLANNRWASEITKVIRLTGDRLTGESVPIESCEFWECGKLSGLNLQINEDDHKYILRSTSLRDAFAYNKDFYTGYELENKIKERNDIDLNYHIKKVLEQEEVESLF